MRKQLITAGLATVVGVTGLVGAAGVANAATDTSSTDPMSGLVEAIATKFNLKESDVQSVFDEQRAKMEAQREAEIKEKVAVAVSDGKITQEQADKINAKRAELKKAREAAKDSGTDKTRAERKAEMEAKRTELETWAKENGIDEQYLRYVMGGGRGHGGPGHGPDSHNKDDASTELDSSSS